MVFKIHLHVVVGRVVRFLPPGASILSSNPLHLSMDRTVNTVDFFS